MRMHPSLQPEQQQQQPEPLEAMHMALEQHDQVGFAAANMDYIASMLPMARSLQQTGHIYTELHRVGDQGQLLIVPSTDSARSHWATVDGQHSIFDVPTMNFNQQNAVLMQERELGARFGLHYRTVVVKGMLVAEEGTVPQKLSLRSIRTRTPAENAWLQQLTGQSDRYGGMAISFDPSYSDFKQNIGEERLPLRISASAVREYVPLAHETPDVLAGFVREAIEVEPPQIITNSMRQIYSRASLNLRAKEGRSNLHAPVYQAEGVDTPHWFTLDIGDLRSEVAIHYTMDARNNMYSAAVLYKRDQSDNPAWSDLQKMLQVATHNLLSEEITSSDADVTILHRVAEDSIKNQT